MNPIHQKIDSLEALFSRREPEVLAYLPEPGRFKRLHQEADALAERWPDENERPPLFGVLAGIKDIFHVDGFETRAGSRLPPAVLKGAEARAATLLKAAGALIVGKTVTTEFAYFGPGPTRNPHNPAHTPGGSSSGSAAAVAAGLAEIALGSQTIGSINRPAAFCGTIGYKPSYDRISREGVIPLAQTFDHVGLFAADLESAERTAAILARGWQSCRTSTRPVIGVPSGPYLDKAGNQGREHYEGELDFLRKEGFECVLVPVFEDFDAVVERHQVILSAEAARAHRDWFETYGDLYHPRTRELVQQGRRVGDDELEAARSQLAAYRRSLEGLMLQSGIDCWLAPSAPGPAPAGLGSTGDPVMNLPWTQAGLPTLTLPAGHSVDGLPLGLQFIGRWYRDEALFCWAREVRNARARANH